MNRKPDCTITETEYVAPLECLSRGDLERAGGKGANLGELVRAGLPVPAGFVATTAAYERFLARNGLAETIRKALENESAGGASSAGVIQPAFEQKPVPEEVEQELLAAYRQMGQGAVAVRSSATAEDLAEAAFAGQQDTYLNVVGEAALVDAVRRCWASLWNERAIAYRRRQGIDQPAVKLAVVVQRMAPADAAGVMFTANPVSGARDELVIDGSPGLGEAVVAGLVTPDHYVLRRKGRGWKVTERKVGKREVIIRALAGGGTEQVEGGDAPALAESPAVPPKALRELARLGERIQRHFGSPQDIEWAWSGGRAYILQARPITALPSPPPRAGLPQRLLANNFIEMLPVRPYPLDLDTWLHALDNAVEPLFRLMGLDWQLNELFEEDDGVVARYIISMPRPTWKTLLTPFRLAWLMVRYNPLRWRSDPLLAATVARARDLEQRDVRVLPWEELLAMLEAGKEISLLAGGTVRKRYFPRVAFAAARLRFFLQITGQAGKFGTLLSSAENKTLEMNRALEALAARARADAELARVFAARPAVELLAALDEIPAGRAFLAELRGFLDSYGHRETVISTALAPSWKAAPEVALGVIKGFAAYPPPAPAGPPAWQSARDAVLQHRLFRFAPLRAAFLRTLEEARIMIQVREDTHFYATMSLPIFRQAQMEMGRRLVERGALDNAEDVFHLRLAELEPAGGPLAPEMIAALRGAVARRKAARARLDGQPLMDPRLFPAPSADGDAALLLQGMGGSPGVAEGPARIVLNSGAFDRLAPGDILVAPYTNPAWTPLFQRAAGVVVDSGSLASHAAIVAREYGIPAVMATMTGTRALRDGEWIQVDGSRGTVRRVEPPAGEE